MAEKQMAQTFSERIDDLLAGQTLAEDDPLLFLAAEMVAGPALDPSLAFVQRLRRRLLESVPSKRTFRLSLRWSFAGVALSLALALVLVLMWNPQPLSAAEVLARAADAMTAEPGQIEHWVMVIDFAPTAEGLSEITYDPTREYWSRVGVTSDGRLTSVEFIDVAYRADDIDLSHPVSQVYSTPSKLCICDSEHPESPWRRQVADGRWLVADSVGCITFEKPADNDPGPLARYAGEGLHTWISRMQANIERVEFRQDRFEGRPVYSLTYTRVTTQSHTFIPADTDDPSAEAAIKALIKESSSDIVVTSTTTVYIDHETFLPVGAVVISPDNIFTQIVLQYEVLDPDDLDFDPFAWPPER